MQTSTARRSEAGRAPWAGVLFDFDGTLTDTRGMGERILRETLRERQHAPLDEAEEAAVARRIYAWTATQDSSGTHTQLFRVFYRAGRMAGLRRRDAVPFSVLGLYRILRAYPGVALFPGVPELLQRVRDGGLAVGIVTSSRREDVAGKLGEANVARLGALVTRDDVRRRKPEPDALLLAARQLGHPPERLLYVGDMPSDMVAAQRAGMPVVGVCNGMLDADVLRRHGPLDVFADVDAAAGWILGGGAA